VLQKEKARQAQNELIYGEFWTEHRLKTELDEKGNKIYRIIPVQKCVASDLPKTKLVCIDEDGQFTSSDSFKYASRIIHHEMGLAFDFHALRHTHGTMLAESGVNPKAIQKRLRHAKITTTLNTYVHATETLQDQAVEQWEARVRGQK
jgi:integrase